jgi:membrane protein
MLVWVYYASMLVLLGAEFTEVYVQARGPGIVPRSGAAKVVEEERLVRHPAGS